MDRKTLAAYDKDAAAFAKDWHDQPAPVDLHDIVTRFFVRGGADRRYRLRQRPRGRLAQRQRFSGRGI